MQRLAMALCLATALGCQRLPPGGVPKPAPINPPAYNPAVATANDYRSLSAVQLTALLKEKAGYEVSDLKSAGANTFTGTVKSPDGTATLPLTVKVEAGQIVAETKTPAGSSRTIITPSGVKSDLAMP